MKKFMVLYMASGPQFEKMMKDSTPEQRKKGMDAWMKWMNANKASIVEGGAPLGKTKRVDSNGASNTKNEIGGYSVVEAESHDAAAKIFGKDHPHLQMPGAWRRGKHVPWQHLNFPPIFDTRVSAAGTSVSVREKSQIARCMP